MNLDKRRFRTLENLSGVSSDETLFHYFQKGNIITGIYKGGKIAEGTIVGKQTSDQTIELLYNCITVDRELRAGTSVGILHTTNQGLMEIKFDWNWLNGDKSGGKSHYVEIRDDK